MIAVLYFVISIYYGRKNPFFYLLLPFALQQGPGAFIDQSISLGGKNIFSVNDTVFNDLLFIVVFLSACFLIKIKWPQVNDPGSKLIFLHVTYIAVLFLVEYFTSDNSEEVLLTGRNFLYIGLNYFLWLAIFQVIQRGQYEGFLKLLFYITPVSALLYIINSSGFYTVFPKELMYSEIDFESASIVRDFATMPWFLIAVTVIAIQSLLMPIFKIPKYIIYINLVVLPIALLFTFTRSLIISVVMQLMLLMMLNSFSKGAKGIKQAIVFVVLFLVFITPVYLVAERVFPHQVAYFTQRFSGVAQDGMKEENVDVRMAYLDKAMQITEYTSPAFGAGMNKKYYSQMDDIGAWKADSTIPYFLYHTGWTGVVILYLILIYFSIDSTIRYLRTKDWLIAYLASSFITLTLSSLMMGGGALYGSVWTLLNFALYTTVKFDLWKKPVFQIPAHWADAYFRYISKTSLLP